MNGIDVRIWRCPKMGVLPKHPKFNHVSIKIHVFAPIKQAQRWEHLRFQPLFFSDQISFQQWEVSL